MVEKLEAYRAELEAKKTELENTVIDVEAEVNAYREDLLAKKKAERVAEIAKIESDINCINNIIAREQTAGVEATVVVTPVENAE